MNHLNWKDKIKNESKMMSSEEMGWMTMNDFKGNGPKYWGHG